MYEGQYLVSVLVFIAFSSMEDYGESRQSLLCSHIQSMDENEDSNQNLDIELRRIRQHGCFFENFEHFFDKYLSLIYRLHNAQTGKGICYFIKIRFSRGVALIPQ